MVWDVETVVQSCFYPNRLLLSLILASCMPKSIVLFSYAGSSFFLQHGAYFLKENPPDNLFDIKAWGRYDDQLYHKFCVGEVIYSDYQHHSLVLVFWIESWPDLPKF